LSLLETDPQLLATLAEALPHARWLLATKTILAAGVAAATANLVTAPTMIPFASFITITPIQIGMVLSLARVFGRGMTLARVKELAVTFGSAVLGRRVFYYLVDMVPLGGWLLARRLRPPQQWLWLRRGDLVCHRRKAIYGEHEQARCGPHPVACRQLPPLPEKGSLKDNIPSLIADAWQRISDIAAVPGRRSEGTCSAEVVDTIQQQASSAAERHHGHRWWRLPYLCCHSSERSSMLPATRL